MNTKTCDSFILGTSQREVELGVIALEGHLARQRPELVVQGLGIWSFMAWEGE